MERVSKATRAHWNEPIKCNLIHQTDDGLTDRKFLEMAHFEIIWFHCPSESEKFVCNVFFFSRRIDKNFI